MLGCFENSSVSTSVPLRLSLAVLSLTLRDLFGRVVWLFRRLVSFVSFLDLREFLKKEMEAVRAERKACQEQLSQHTETSRALQVWHERERERERETDRQTERDREGGRASGEGERGRGRPRRLCFKFLPFFVCFFRSNRWGRLVLLA